MNRYVCVAVNGVVKYQHVAVAEAALGRALPKGAVVHHVDGNKANNHPGNLVICESQSYHLLLHARARVQAAGGDPNTQKICSRCRAVKGFDCFHKKGAELHDTCKPCRVRPPKNTDWALLAANRCRLRVIAAGGNPDTHRICCRCRKVLPFSDFNRRLSHKHLGLQTACKNCGNEYRRQLRKKRSSAA